MTRTYLEKRELDWVPKELRRVRWLAAPTGLAAVAAASGGVFAVLPLAEAMLALGSVGLYLAAGGMGISFLMDRKVLRPILRHRVRKLAGGKLDLRTLRSSKDGELVHVRGTVKAGGATIESVLDPSVQCVYRRVRQNVDGTCVLHEDARDFSLVDGSGEEIRIEVGESRLVAPGPELPWRDVNRATYLALLDRAAEVVPPGKVIAQSRTWMLHVGEMTIPTGTTIDVIGWKTRVVDFTIEERLARETPMRNTLRGGGALPLLVSPA